MVYVIAVLFVAGAGYWLYRQSKAASKLPPGGSKGSGEGGNAK